MFTLARLAFIIDCKTRLDDVEESLLKPFLKPSLVAGSFFYCSILFLIMT